MFTVFTRKLRSSRLLVFVYLHFASTGLTKGASSNRSLTLLHIVYRHGDRTPISTYKDDPYPLSVWKEGPGQLTNTGCKQHYLLGGHLRNIYSNHGLITGNPHEIHVRSSDRDRCLASASCHLAGMYPPSGRWVWDDKFDWQPVAIHTRPVEEDPMLAPGEGDCPAATKEDERIKASPEGQLFLEKYHKLYVYLTEMSGSIIKDWSTTEQLFNTLYIEKLYNFTLPKWTEKVWSNMSYQYDQSFVFYAKTPLLQRLRAGPLLGDITAHMAAISENKSENNYKVYMYSSHDTEIASLREALEIFNNKAPEYCSTVIFELWREADNTYSVDTYTLDANHMDPQPLTIPGCGTQSCPLPTFLKVARAKVPADWAQECGLKKLITFSTTELAIIAGVMAVLLLTVFVVGLYCVCSRHGNKKRTVAYSPLPTELSIN
ncbi:prostatic acid phosphatase-like [Ornithodoros turicata]|uniref:prostatic acid phosphatase-like n=1 Tax=Ornithodoros turicata TaxID=34597 RepID=UPI003138F313